MCITKLLIFLFINILLLQSYCKQLRVEQRVSDRRELVTCNSGCQSCTSIAQNCSTCKGSNRILPTCECDRGFYDTGVDSCQQCNYKCLQCQYLPDEYPVLQLNGGIHGTQAIQPSAQDFRGITGTVYRVTGGINIGQSGVYPKTLTNNEHYEFCVWIRKVTGQALPTDMRLHLSGGKRRLYHTDQNGTIHLMYTSTEVISAQLSETSWQRFCVTNTVTSSNHVIRIGQPGGSGVFEYSLPQLNKIRNVDAQALPYTVGKKTELCQFCSHSARTGPNCECFPGYKEVTPGSVECHAPKPSECNYFVRIQSAGWSPLDPLTREDVSIYVNDVQIGTPATRGFNFYVVDAQLNLIQQEAYDTHLGDNNDVANMIAFINGLSDGQMVLVAIADEAAVTLTPDAYTALQSLGLNEYTVFHFRDAFAMIGIKGAQPGSTKQFHGVYTNKARAFLAHCVKCTDICYQCLDEQQEFQLLEDIYTLSGYQLPVVDNTIADPFGNTGTNKVFHTSGKVRFGLFGPNDMPLDTIIKGFTYQFSIWIKEKPSQQLDTTFEFDVVDRYTNRFKTDEQGSIIKILNSAEHGLQDDIFSDSEWVKIVLTAIHDNVDYYHFMDIGQYSSPTEYYFAYPQLFRVPYVQYPPIRHIEENPSSQQCYRCTHYTRIPPNCDCASGYQDLSGGLEECEAPVPDTCSKFIKIESAGMNYAELNPGDYLRMYINDVELGSFTRGLSFVVLNETTFVKESQQTFDSGDFSFDPQPMIDFINNLANDKIVLVGIKNDGSQNLNAQAYSALQSLGIDSSTTINYRDGFAMIGKKGATPGSVTQHHSIMLKGCKANIVECLKGCDYQCGTCQNESDNCLSCSHNTRDMADSCECNNNNGYFDDGQNNAQCQSCSFPCVNCSSQNVCLTCNGSNRTALECDCDIGYYEDNNVCEQCLSKCTQCSNGSECTVCKNGASNSQCDCGDGFFDNTNSCDACDNTICGTCTGSATNCLTGCHISCKTCNTDGSCATCDSDRNLQSNICKCNNGTYDNNNNCEACSPYCATCDQLNQCLTCLNTQNRNSAPSCDCQDGYFNNSSNVCEVCDNTQCGTCTGSATSCDTSCDISCKTCNTDGTCATCDNDRNLVGGVCKCNNGTYDNNNNCESCSSYCSTCDQLNQCLTCLSTQNRNSAPTCDCVDGYFNNSSNVCEQCDTTQCATCTGSATNCGTNCHISCSTCNTSGNCSTCDNDRHLENNICECNDGTYDNNNNCEACSPYCATCDQLNQCLTCLNTQNRNAAPTCDCVDGYFNNSSNVCEQCDTTQCATCTGSATNCDTNCNIGCNTCNPDGTCIDCEANRQLNGSQCECIPGMYQNGSICEPCDNTVCGTCLTGPTDCDVSCNPSCDSCETDGQCSSCSNREYLDNNTQCQNCSNKCQRCTELNSCQICLDNINRNPQPGCECSEGYYEDQTDYSCKACDYTQCGTCLNQADNCIQSCHSSCKTCDKNGDCLTCENSFFLDNGICKPCSPVCQTCSVSENSCTQCIDNNNRNTFPACDCIDGFYLDTNSLCQQCTLINCQICENNSICQVCEDGFYKDDIGTCQACDNTLCATCQNQADECLISCQEGCLTCNLDGSCQSCKEGYFVDENGECTQCQNDNCACTNLDNCDYCIGQDSQFRSLPNCECKKGYFLNQDGICQECSPLCKTCENSPENCLICKKQEGRSLTTPNCECSEGYYEDNQSLQCNRCSSQCKSCENSDKCLVCVNQKMSAPDCIKIKNSFIYTEVNDSDNNDFLICDIQCHTCEDQSYNCTQCKIEENRSTQTPFCNCNPGYHDSNGQLSQCEKCDSQCLTCSTYNICTTCSEENNRELDEYTQNCVCKRGYKEKQDGSIKCQKCYYYKDQCVSKCPSQTTPNKDYICSDLQVQNQSYVILIWVSFSVTLLFSIGLVLLLGKKLPKQNQQQIINEKNIDLEKV